MNKFTKNIFWVPITLLLIITVFTIFYCPTKVETVFPNKGQLNLQKWNHQSIVELAGEWSYYENVMINDIHESQKEQYITLPHFFGNEQKHKVYGVATYKLKVTDLHPNTLYALHIINEVSAYRLVINGEDILKAGTVGYSKDTHRPQMKGQIGYFKPDEQGNINILLEISNFSYNYGGFWKEILIGPENILSTHIAHEYNVDIFLFTSIFMLGLFFLALYSTNRKSAPLLYFSIVCIVIAIRITVTNNKLFYDFIYNISWDLGTRLEFLSGYLLFPFFTLFMHSLNYIKVSKYVQWFLYVFIVISFVITMFTPNDFYANLLPYYMNLCIMSLFYCAFIIIQGIRKKKPKAILILIGSLGLVTTTLIDFYAQPDYYTLPFGTFFMLMFFSVVVIMDFLTIKQKHDYLEHAVTVDPLTGLKNRFYLNQLLDTSLQIDEFSKYYIFFFDLNKFKYINDTYGHNIGDAVLVESANRIRNHFDTKTDIVCRYGGDEFVAFKLVKSNDQTSKQIVGDIMHTFKKPSVIEGKEYFITTSIGVAEYYQHDDLEKIINSSDDAMYKAKKAMAMNI